MYVHRNKQRYPVLAGLTCIVDDMTRRLDNLEASIQAQAQADEADHPTDQV